MVLHEIVVSFLITYSSSEYLHGSRRRALYAATTALAANGLLLLPAAAPMLGLKSKVPIIAICFLAALYVDTRRQLSRLQFLAELQEAAFRLVPLFPLFSILVAFMFLELGELMEHLLGMTEARISLWLNQPIYYGVLYGPFAYVYIRVKAAAKSSTLLPRSV